MNLIWIIEANYIKDYQIFVKFNDGVSGIVDLNNQLKGPIFGDLKNINNFKNFSLNKWTIVWPNGADLAPEYLYQRIKTEYKVPQTAE